MIPSEKSPYGSADDASVSDDIRLLRAALQLLMKESGIRLHLPRFAARHYNRSQNIQTDLKPVMPDLAFVLLDFLQVFVHSLG